MTILKIGNWFPLVVVALAPSLMEPASAQPKNLAPRPVGTKDASIRLSRSHSDNLLRIPGASGPSGEYTGLGVRFDYLRETNRVELDFFGDIEERSYSISGIETEPVGDIRASVAFDVVPERFIWEFQDQYGVGRANPVLPTAPLNRQTINVFSTGPRLDLPLGGRTSLLLDLSRAESDFENISRVDNEVDEFEIAVSRRLNSTASVSIGAFGRDLTYDLTPSTIERDSYYVSYQSALASGNAMVKVGQSKLNSTGRSLSGSLVDFSWTRDLSARSRLGISLSNDFSDATNAFIRSTGSAGALGPGANFIITVRDPFELTSAGINYSMTNGRNSFRAYIGAGRSRYAEAIALDNDERFVTLNYQRAIRPQLQLGISGAFSDRDFPVGDVEGSERYSEIFLAKQFAGRWTLRASVQDYAREGVQQIGSYEEFSVLVGISFDLIR